MNLELVGRGWIKWLNTFKRTTVSWFGFVTWRKAGRLVGITLIWLQHCFLFKSVVCGHCLLALPLSINEALEWVTTLPIWMKRLSDGDSIAVVALFPYLLGCRFLPVPLERQLGIKTTINKGSRDSSVIRTPDLWSKGRGFESWLEWQENFLQLSVLTLISVSAPPLCYRSST